MAGIGLGVVSLRGEQYERLFYEIYSGSTDIFTPKDIQMMLFNVAIYSDRDSTIRDFFVLDRIATLLQAKYSADSNNITKTAHQSQLKFPGLYGQYQDGAKKRNSRRFNKIFDFQQKYLFADQDIVSADGGDDYFDKPLDFPFTALYQPTTLWYEYARLAEERFGIRVQLVTIPHDATVRTIIVESPEGEVNIEEVLRTQYLRGEGGIIDNRFFIQDVLTYLKPQYKDKEQDLLKSVNFIINSDLTSISQGRLRMDIQVGKYLLPIEYDFINSQIFSLDGNLILGVDPKNMILWQKSIISEIKSFIEQKTAQDLTELDQNQLLLLLYPVGLDFQLREVVRDRAIQIKEKLSKQEDQRVIHPFGTLIKIKRNEYIEASSLLFTYGDRGRLGVRLNIKGVKIDLLLDDKFNLVSPDGSALDIPPEAKEWWESVVLSHLSEYLFKEGKLVIDTQYTDQYQGEDAETIKRINICRPYRRRLPEGHKLGKDHELAVESNPLMQGLVNKITREPGESFLQAYNRLHPAPDGRIWNWILPPSDEKIDELIRSGRLIRKPIVIETPKAFDYISVN